MKAARLVVLTVALAAGGVAALLAGRSHKPAPAVPAKVATVDILVANTDIPLGQAISAKDVKWQSWPANVASNNFIRRSDRPHAIEKLAGSMARWKPEFRWEEYRGGCLRQGRFPQRFPQPWLAEGLHRRP